MGERVAGGRVRGRVWGASKTLREFWLLFGEGFAMLGTRQNPDASCASEFLSERRTFKIERSTLNSFTATLGFLRRWLFDVRCSMLTCRSGAGSCWVCCLFSRPGKALPKNRQSFPSASMPIACGTAGLANVSAHGLTCGALTIAAAETKAPTPVIFFINWPTIST